MICAHALGCQDALWSHTVLMLYSREMVVVRLTYSCAERTSLHVGSNHSIDLTSQKYNDNFILFPPKSTDFLYLISAFNFYQMLFAYFSV